MPKIVTLTCERCGTVVAANVLESTRTMKCPALDCETIIRFSDLPESERTHVLENRDSYRMN